MTWRQPPTTFWLCGLLLAIGSFQLCSSIPAYEWLMETDPPENLEKAVILARKEVRRWLPMLRAMPGLTVFLPNDDAWDEVPYGFEALMTDQDEVLTYDIILGATADVDGAVDWPTLKAQARAMGGLIDTAYGASYFVEDDENFGGRLCNALWLAGEYWKGKCSRLQLPPILLDDATIYRTRRLILPEELMEALAEIAEVYRNSVLEVTDEVEDVSNVSDTTQNEEDSPANQMVESNSPYLGTTPPLDDSQAWQLLARAINDTARKPMLRAVADAASLTSPTLPPPPIETADEGLKRAKFPSAQQDQQVNTSAPAVKAVAAEQPKSSVALRG